MNICLNCSIKFIPKRATKGKYCSIFCWLHSKEYKELRNSKEYIENHQKGCRTESFRTKLRNANLGKKESPESIEKRASKLRGRKRPPITEEWRKNLSISHLGIPSGRKGKKATLEQIEKNRLSHLGKKYPNRKRKKPVTEIERQNRREGALRAGCGKWMKDKIGELSSNWQGGKSFEKYGREWTKELKTFVRKRDKFVCQICLKHGWIVHHIDYDKKNCNLDNLITLCSHCHMKTNYNRVYWQGLLTNIIKKIYGRKRRNNFNKS